MTTACTADDAPVGVPTRCVGTCVASVEVATEHLTLVPSDTFRLRARARTASGSLVAVRWSTWNAVLGVDSGGLVAAQSPGKGWVFATAITDPTKLSVAEIWVVDPDSSGQPFIAAFRDAASGDEIPRWRGFIGHDSVDATVSYVVGRMSETAGNPHALLQIRVPDGSNVLSSTAVPLTVRGRGAFVDIRIHLTQRDARGVRLFPPGTYDLFVLLPLAMGGNWEIARGIA